jgi:uncharacterized repeat protein (TIGR01451 family)
MKKQQIKKIILGTLITIATLISFQGSSLANENCIPNENTFRNGITHEDCLLGTTKPSFNAYTDQLNKLTNRTFDERDFFQVKKINDGNYTNRVSVEPGEKIRFKAYLHNNCDPDLNDAGRGVCVAQNVKTFAKLFTEQNSKFVTDSRRSHKITQTFSASNTTPRSVTDEAYVDSQNQVFLEYIQDTAVYRIPAADADNFIELPDRQFFTSGAPLTSVVSTDDRCRQHDQCLGDVFGSNLYSLVVYFDVIVRETPPPPPPQADCTNLDLTLIRQNENTVDFRVRTTPNSFQELILVGSTPSRSIEAIGNSRTDFRLTGVSDGLVIEAEVPGEARCRDSLTINVTPPPADDLCTNLTLTPATFDPNRSTNFQVRLTPNNLVAGLSIQQIAGNEAASFSSIDATGPVGSFTVDRAFADTVIRVKVTDPDLIAPGRTCEAETRAVPPVVACTDLVLTPQTYSANGSAQTFRVRTVPGSFPQDFIWTTTAPNGRFRDQTGQTGTSTFRTSQNEVTFEGGSAGSQVTVRVADSQFATVCNAVASPEATPERPPEVDIIKTANQAFAVSGDTVNYKIEVTNKIDAGTTVSYRVLDSLGRFNGRLPNSERDGGILRYVQNSMTISLPACTNATQENCATGRIDDPNGIKLQNLTSQTTKVIIAYRVQVASATDSDYCERKVQGRDFCGEIFRNEVVIEEVPSNSRPNPDNNGGNGNGGNGYCPGVNENGSYQNFYNRQEQPSLDRPGTPRDPNCEGPSRPPRRAAHTLSVLCPAFRSFGFGDLLIEEDFRTGIDTLSCANKPNTEGVVLIPLEPIEVGPEVVSTGSDTLTRPEHGECRKEQANKVLDRISSSLCELTSEVSKDLKNPLDSVKRNADLLCKNAPAQNTVTIRSGETAELKRYANPKNQNELVICAQNIEIAGNITLEHNGPVTLIAKNKLTVNGTVSYSRTPDITPLLVAITYGSGEIKNTNSFSGFFIILPDKNGTYQKLTITPQTRKAVEIIGALIGTNFELGKNDLNIRYDGGRLLLTEPSVLNDALEFIRELTL